MFQSFQLQRYMLKEQLRAFNEGSERANESCPFLLPLLIARQQLIFTPYLAEGDNSSHFILLILHGGKKFNFVDIEVHIDPKLAESPACRPIVILA